MRNLKQGEEGVRAQLGLTQMRCRAGAGSAAQTRACAERGVRSALYGVGDGGAPMRGRQRGL